MYITKTARIKLAIFNFIMWFGLAFIERLGFATLCFIFAAIYLAYEISTND